MSQVETNEWADAVHAQGFLDRRGQIPQLDVGYAELLEILPDNPNRVLDLGCGDGKVMAMIGGSGVAVDFSPHMLELARARFHADDVEVVEHNTRLEADNILEIIEDYDVIVDGADNFPTRYLLNDASVRLRKPVISASILAFEGQISTFVPYEGPCYRCLYPVPPPPELAPSCGAAGVLGVMAGVMGLLQANEVIKLAAGIGEPLIGRLLLYDSLGTRFTELKVKRDPDCPVCGEDAAQIPESELGRFPDYEAFCAGHALRP